MSSRRIIQKILLFFSAGLALLVWQSISRAVPFPNTEVLTWTSSSNGLFLSTAQYPTQAAWNAGAAAAHVSPGAFEPTGLTFQTGLNLTAHDLIVNADNTADAQAAYSYLYQAAAAGYNDGWAGDKGLYSDASQTPDPSGPSAATDPFHITGIGVVLNDGDGANLSGNDPAYTSFDGASVNVNTVLVKFTYYGDTDLDGIIEPYDVGLTQAAYTADQTFGPSYENGWANGESDYSETVTKFDENLVREANMLQSDDPIVFPSDPSSTPVPEPGSVILAAIGAVGMLFVRRRYRIVQKCG